MDVSRSERRIRRSTTASGPRAGRHRSRALAVAGVAALVVGLGTGTAGAVVNNYSSITDGSDNLVEISQGDTSIVGVPPLDSSPLSREFFHSGYAEARISGPGADSMSGSKISFGYQVGYPIALTGATIQLNTPGLGYELESKNGIDLIGFLPGGDDPDFILGFENRGMLAGDIIPQQNLIFDLEPGGITDVPVIEDKEFGGPFAKIRIGNVHGSVSGAIGPVTLRPYAKVELASGDIVMTYGAPVPI
ncbi:Porin MspA [Rhodococcus sp. RD6.2]|uniref:MspA family porin n=1 Tax=Rhodococcus sp. RD6.2 TaxID=260936 RepID=UPI00063B0F34|nr:MspA family porin [Rhodococcus sp. RD6.2]CRK51042.1 Porin MspA [Rhodococcus sp. RD6.2]